MLPEKHFKDLESSEKRHNLFKNFLTASAFLLAFVLIGPILHELSHIMVLELKNCSYFFSFDFMFPNGIYATVEPLCSIKPSHLIVFYSSGYLATLAAGTSLNIISSIYSDSYRLLSALGTGMLLSVILTIGVKGDIHNALEAAGLSTSYSGLISLLIVLGVLGASIHGVEMLLELERKE